MSEFRLGDRVFVRDAGLAQLKTMYERMTGEPAPPNHIGTVTELMPDGAILIDFDDGGCAPYPSDMVSGLDE